MKHKRIGSEELWRVEWLVTNARTFGVNLLAVHHNRETGYYGASTRKWGAWVMSLNTEVEKKDMERLMDKAAFILEVAWTHTPMSLLLLALPLKEEDSRNTGLKDQIAQKILSAGGWTE